MATSPLPRLVLLAAVLTTFPALAGSRRTATADVLPPGRASVSVTAEFDWGPLAARLAHPVTAKADDTWESLATREAGDARWAPTVRALNGGADRPASRAATWVPPREVAFGSEVAWYSAFLDASKFGAQSDVSRTGFERLDPAGKPVPVFGTVTVALVRHAKPEDAARAAALPRTKPREALAARGEAALVVAAPFEVATSVPETSRVRSVRQRWRCLGVEGTTLRLERVSEESRDADGRVVAGLGGGMPGLRSEWLAGLVAFVVLSIALLALSRRRRRRALAA